MGPAVDVGHVGLFLSALATPAPAAPRRASPRAQTVAPRQAEVHPPEPPAHAPGTSPGLREQGGCPSVHRGALGHVHVDRLVRVHACEWACTVSPPRGTWVFVMRVVWRTCGV